MSEETTAIAAESLIGRVLIALRAGPMSSGELSDRFSSLPSMRDLVSKHLVADHDLGYRITDAGRAVCPLRNPLAATVRKPMAMSLARSAAPIGLSAKTARQPTVSRHEKPVYTGGIRMPNPARTHTPTAVDLLRRILIDAPAGVARKELIKRTGLAPHAVDNAITNLITRGEVERKGYGVIAPIAAGVTTLAARMNPDTPTVASAAAAVPQLGQMNMAPLPTPGASIAADPDAPEIDFMIHADGRLSITDGDEILVLPPDATKRLGYFLGCLERNTWPPRFDPAALQPQSIAA